MIRVRLCENARRECYENGLARVYRLLPTKRSKVYETFLYLFDSEDIRMKKNATMTRGEERMRNGSDL